MSALKRIVLALSVIALGVVGACDAPNPSALTIVGNVVPDNSCTVKVAGGGQQIFIMKGRLDVTLGTRYVIRLMMNSNFPQFESLTGFQPEDAQLDGSTVTLNKLHVKLHLPQTTQGPLLFVHSGEAAFQTALVEMAAAGITFDTSTFAFLEYDIPVMSVIPPANSGVVIADLIPPQVGSFFRLFPELMPSTIGSNNGQDAIFSLISELHVEGTRADGRFVQSGTLQYPVEICHNCLVEHIFPESIASKPFNPVGEGEPLSDDDLGTACTVGADSKVTNAMCGALWGGPVPKDACALQRCLGTGSSDNLDNLVCNSDPVTFSAQPPAEEAGLF